MMVYSYNNRDKVSYNKGMLSSVINNEDNNNSKGMVNRNNSKVLD